MCSQAFFSSLDMGTKSFWAAFDVRPCVHLRKSPPILHLFTTRFTVRCLALGTNDHGIWSLDRMGRAYLSNLTAADRIDWSSLQCTNQWNTWEFGQLSTSRTCAGQMVFPQVPWIWSLSYGVHGHGYGRKRWSSCPVIKIGRQPQNRHTLLLDEGTN